VVTLGEAAHVLQVYVHQCPHIIPFLPSHHQHVPDEGAEAKPDFRVLGRELPSPGKGLEILHSIYDYEVAFLIQVPKVPAAIVAVF